MRLAAIHIRLRRRVDQRIELQSAERCSQFLWLPETELRVIKSNDVEQTGVFTRQRGAKTTTGADDDNPLHAAQLRRRFQTPNNPLTREAPNPKLQAPNKFQTPNLKEEPHRR